MAAASASAASSGGGRPRRVLMFPLPFQGHLNPMLQLAGALHARGGGLVGITVFHAAFNAPNPARHPPGYRFVPVGEGVPSADLIPSGSDADFAGALGRINDRLREPFRDLLRQALADAEDDEAAACLVVDSNLRGIQLVAEELGVPTLVLRTGGAACLVAYMAFPALCDKGLLPPASQDKVQLDMPLDELTPLRLRDMVFSRTTTHANMRRCLQDLLDAGSSSSGIILNTFQDLENSDVQKISNGLGVPLYTIGPLHKISSGTEGSLLAQDQTCLKWLDKQEADPPSSLLPAHLPSLQLETHHQQAARASHLPPRTQPNPLSITTSANSILLNPFSLYQLPRGLGRLHSASAGASKSDRSPQAPDPRRPEAASSRRGGPPSGARVFALSNQERTFS